MRRFRTIFSTADPSPIPRLHFRIYLSTDQLTIVIYQNAFIGTSPLSSIVLLYP